MTRLPQVSGQEIMKALKKIGYSFDRQRGSHIIRQVGLTVDEFVALLD